MKLNNFNDLFAKLFSNILFIEKQCFSLFPKMLAKTKSQDIKNVIEQNLKEMQTENLRIEKIFTDLKLQKSEDSSTKSIFENAEKILQDNEASPLLDAAIISCLQQIEHTEAASYSSIEAFAQILGVEEINLFIEESLREIAKVDDVFETLEKDKFYSPAKI